MTHWTEVLINQRVGFRFEQVSRTKKARCEHTPHPPYMLAQWCCRDDLEEREGALQGKISVSSYTHPPPPPPQRCRADLEEREGALQQLLAVCEAQVASAAAAAAAEATERAGQLQAALEQQQRATAEAGEQAAELRAALALQEQAAAEAAGRASGLQAALAQQEQAVAEAGERVVELQVALALRAQAIEQLQQEVEVNCTHSLLRPCACYFSMGGDSDAVLLNCSPGLLGCWGAGLCCVGQVQRPRCQRRDAEPLSRACVWCTLPQGKAAQVLALEAAAAGGAEERRRLEADLEAQAVHINQLQAQVGMWGAICDLPASFCFGFLGLGLKKTAPLWWICSSAMQACALLGQHEVGMQQQAAERPTLPRRQPILGQAGADNRALTAPPASG